MRKILILSALAACTLAFTPPDAFAGPKGGGKHIGAGQMGGNRTDGAAPRASTTGMARRSDVANTRGAKKRGFCPPGQARKPGNGSAFNC